MFNKNKVQIQTDAASFPSERSASAIRRPENRQRFAPVSAIAPVESPSSHDRSVTLMGVVFSLAFAISAFAAMMHIWVSAGMIR